jgi:multiple sugar transport system substrate-binding protein
MEPSARRFWWQVVALVVLVSMLVTACAAPQQTANNTPQVVEKVVTQVVEKPVTQVVEKQSTVIVEKQVTQVVTQTASSAGGAQTANVPKLNPDVKGDVQFWHFWASPVRRAGVRRIIAMCEQKLPNIKVTDTVKPFGDIWTANVAAVAGGSGMPDVIVSDRPTLPKDAADGVYQPLQDMADRDNVKRDQYYPWAWDQTLYQGKTYGIPFETDVRVLFWNKNAFKDAGLDPEKPPKTWDDVMAMADKLDKKNADGTYSRIAFMPLWNAGPDIWGYTNSVQWITPDQKPVINSPEAVQTYEWIKKWVDRYGGYQNLQNFKAKFAAPPNDLFMSGSVAMIVDIFGYYSQLQFYRPKYTGADGKSVNMDWGIGMLPYNTKPGDWSGGFSLSIPTGAKNPAAAWEFIKCMAGYEGQLSWARDTQAQPTDIQAATDPVLSADPNWKIVDESLKVSTGGNYLAKYPNWSEQLNQRNEKVWLGQLTPKEALDQAQAAVEAAISK